MHDKVTPQRTIYLRGLLQGHGTLSLPLGSGLSFSLLQIFQPLRLRQSAANDEKQPKENQEEIQQNDQEDTREKDELEKHENTQDVLAENGIDALNKSQRGRMVILGGPGTGKTTVLKHLLYHHAQLALEDHTAPLPIFLSLPDLARAGQDLDAYLAHIAQEMGLETEYGRTLWQAIVHGHAFVCLDSLDEVLPRQRAGIIRQINALAQGEGNIWIVGSRFTDYKGGQFQHGQFQEWELQPLDHERRLKLASHLLPELQRQLALPTQSTHSPQAYVQALSEHQQAATWGTNPLLFSLGAVVYLRRGNLSGSRAMLYREVIDALLETRGGDAQLRQILAQIALELYQIKGRTFTLADLDATLTSLNAAQQATWSVEEMRYRVLNSGVLDVVAAETYSFRHQTFQEYLVASALAHRFMSTDEQTRMMGQQLAWSKHAYSRWNQIERLLVGILVQEYGEAGTIEARAWFTRLLGQHDKRDGDPGNLSLELAINVLGEVAQLEEWQVAADTLGLEEMAATVWAGEVKKSMLMRGGGRFYKQRYHVMAVDIGRLRPMAQQKAIDLLLNVLIEGEYSQLSEILGAIHSSFLTPYLLDVLVHHPDSSNQQHIKSIFEHMGEFAPVDLLLSELNLEDHDRNSSAKRSLMRLALYVPAEKVVPVLHLHGFGRPQAAEDILKAIAARKELPIQDLLTVLHGADDEAALHAACVLAAIHHPAAIDLLLIYLDNAHPDKRKKALHALRAYEMQAPLDRMLLTLKDSDVNVRQTMVDVLADLGSSAPLEALVQATSDPDATVRYIAINALGQLGDQALLEVLVRATNDPVLLVVKSAVLALGLLGHHASLELLLGFLDNPEFVDSVLEALNEKQMARHVPVELLLDLYERNWQVRAEILEILVSGGYPLASTLLVRELSTKTNYYITYIVAQLLARGVGSLFDTEQRDAIGERCDVVYERAVIILGDRRELGVIDVLMQALADERGDVSHAAAKVLCNRANEPAQTDLLVLLKHKHPWVRANALQVIAERTDSFPVELLVAALDDSSDSVRAAAAKALRTHGEGVSLDKLFAATQDAAREVCQEAALTLSRWGRRDPALAVAGVMNLVRSRGDLYTINEAFEELIAFTPVELLVQALYDSGRIEIASLVVKALGKMGERMPVEELAQALQDQNEYIREAAASALSLSGKRAPVAALIKALDAKNSGKVRSKVMVALTNASAYGEVPDEIFLQKIFKKGDYSTYTALFQAFSAQSKLIPEEIVLDALEHFPHKSSLVVLHYLDQFAERLSALPEKSVVMALVLYAAPNYRSSKPDTLEMIKRLLSRLPVGAVLELVTHQKSKLRIGAVSLLAEYPGAIPLEPILSALRDPDPDVRRRTIECLQKRPEPLPVQPIIACLQDVNISVCQEAIGVLASLGAQAPVSDLMALLDSPSMEIRSATIQVLAQPGLVERVPAEMFINALGDEYYDEGRQVALKALSVKDPRVAIEYCIAVLGDSDDDLALAAFRLLEQIHPAIIPEIVQEATALFQGGKPSRFFRTLSEGFLADLIRRIGLARPDLIAQLGEQLDWPYGEVRMKAAWALGELRRNIPDAIIRRLLDLRHDPHSLRVRLAADIALAEILSLETGIEDD